MVQTLLIRCEDAAGMWKILLGPTGLLQLLGSVLVQWIFDMCSNMQLS